MRLHKLARALSEMERAAKVYLLLCSLSILLLLSYLALFQSGAAWLHIALPAVMETLLAACLLTVFGTVVLDLAYKEQKKTEGRK